ncbi:Protein of unknown function, partial [Gryllus bimaculatus]
MLLEGGGAGGRRWAYVGDAALRDFPREALKAACADCQVVVVDVEREVKAARALLREAAPDLRMVVVLESEAGDCPLEGPRPSLEAPQEDWRLEHLTADAQEEMMDAEVLFQVVDRRGRVGCCGRGRAVRVPGLRGAVGRALLAALAAAEGAPPRLGGELPAAEDARAYVPLSLQHAPLLRPSALRALDPARHLLALSGFPADEVSRLRRDAADADQAPAHALADRWVRLEDSFAWQSAEGASRSDAAAFAQLCLAHPSRHVHWVERAAAGDAL